MRGGVLIVGSLAWDQSDLRRRWRESRLSMHDRLRVRAPIRYGRRSKSRDNTYTMVFSADCFQDRVATGVGLAVPFARQVTAEEDLIEEATELWRVESNDASGSGALSASWGSVALLVNPENPNIRPLLPAWARAVSHSPRYGELSVAKGEAEIVSKTTGLTCIHWPSLVGSDRPLELDFLLLTATAAQITNGRYPDPLAVGEAWRKKPTRAEYFTRNRKWGIETADDSVIEAILESS